MNFWFSAFVLMWKITEKIDDKTRASQTLPEGIAVERDIPYGDGGAWHRMNAYYPIENNGKLPVIIDIHGGGWMYGDKDSSVLYDEYLASRGFLVFSMSYRLAPEVTPLEQLKDVSNALSAIKKTLPHLPCDPEKIMLTGDSAGGMLAAYTAAIAVSPSLQEHFEISDPGLKYNCLVLTSPVAYMNENSLMGSYGRLMWRERPFRESSKQFLNANEALDLAKTLPPVMLITSEGDVVARKQTLQLYGYLRRRDMDARLLYITGKEGKKLPHVFAVQKPNGEYGKRCLDGICEFFGKTQ